MRTPAIRGQIGKGGDQLLPVFLSADEMRAKAEPLEKHRGAIFKQKYLPQVTAFPEVRDLFEQLRADGKRLVLASSAKKDEIAVYKRVANIADLVSIEVSGDDVENPKPRPDIFESALRKLGPVRPAEAVRPMALGTDQGHSDGATAKGICRGAARRQLQFLAVYPG